VLHFAHADTGQDLQAIATIIRSMTGSRHVDAGAAQGTLAVRGTAGQIALAEWLINDLDSPGNRQGTQSHNQTTHEYRPPGGTDDVVRVFYLTYAETQQSSCSLP